MKYSEPAESKLITNNKELTAFEQGWYKAEWNLCNDIVKLCDTLDAFREPTQEEKELLARQRYKPEPSQADVMQSGRVTQKDSYEKRSVE